MTQMAGFQQLIKYPNDFVFDLTIYDYTMGPCFLGFSHKFNYPPIVSITALNNPTFTSEIIGGHQYYSYVPHLSYFADEMHLSFSKRIYNFMYYTIENL